MASSPVIKFARMRDTRYYGSSLRLVERNWPADHIDTSFHTTELKRSTYVEAPKLERGRYVPGKCDWALVHSGWVAELMLIPAFIPREGLMPWGKDRL